MKKYKKPTVVSVNGVVGIVPAAAIAAGLSVGGAFLAGVASGLMKDNMFSNPQVFSIKKVNESV